MPLVARAFPTFVDGSVGRHDALTTAAAVVPDVSDAPEAAEVPGILVDSAAAAIAAFLGETGAASRQRPVIVVPSAWMVAPLKRALRSRLARPGTAWIPPPVATLEGHAAAAHPAAGPVRSRHARLLAIANRLAQGGLPRGGAQDAQREDGWSGRFRRASGLLDLIDAVDAARAIDALAAGTADAGADARADPGAEDRAWRAWHGGTAQYLRDLASRACGEHEHLLGHDLQLLAAIADDVADPADPVRVQARQWPWLLRRWRDAGAVVMRVGLHAMDEDAVHDRGDRVLRALLVRHPGLPVIDFHPQPGCFAQAAPALAAAWPEIDGPTAPPPIGVRRLGRDGREAAGCRVARSLLHARSREDEAALAAQWVHGRLAAGARSVSILVADRWLARRCRALLERSGILIDDREGWALSTTVAATLVMAWLDFCRQPEAMTQAGPRAELVMTALLDSAFADAGTAGSLLQAVRRRQRDMRRGGATSALPAQPAALAQQLTALAARQRRAARLGEHLDCLRASLGTLGAMAGLQQDEAGRQLLALLDALPAAAPGRCRLEQFRALLGFALESQRFHDGSIRSPVLMIGLAEAVAARCDAMLVLGANDGRLPAAAALPPAIAEAMMAPLGLAPVAQQALRQTTALAWALTGAGDWACTCRTEAADGSLPSQLVERLAAVAGVDLAARQDRVAPRRLPPPDGEAQGGRPMMRPAEPVARMPAEVAVGAIERLVGCPYEFLVADVWGLADAGEATEAPGKRELGIVVHEALLRFHRELPEPLDEASMTAYLLRITGEVVAADASLRAERLVHLQEWYAAIPGYVRWFREDHGEGWRFRDGEQRVAGVVRYGAAADGGDGAGGKDGADGELAVRGKYDRIDVRGDVRRIVDYKLQNPARIRKRAADPDQAAQLMLYSWLADAAQAAYVAIDRKGSLAAPLDPPPAEALAAWQKRLAAYLDRIARGEPLRALGSHCQRCRARGVCRQGHWLDE